MRREKIDFANLTNRLDSVISVVEGFEGDPDENRHRSTRGGWRFAGLPWEQD